MTLIESIVTSDDYHNYFGEYHPDCLFQKKQQLRFQDDHFQLPDPTKFYQEPTWKVPELMTLKVTVNQTKELLDNFDLKIWHRHTRHMNNAQFVLNKLREVAAPEFCSRAWAKFFEMLYSYSLIPKVYSDVAKEEIQSGLTLNSVHLCEAPGAFISALNHFLSQNMPVIKWNWVATTLNPYFEGNDVNQMINEDKLILGSWKKWSFLKDGTGNLLLEENIRDFADVEIPNKMSKQVVHLVTADGSIDCQTNPGEQEALVTHLHLAEILTALKVLAKGGSFVLKIFTFFECDTICHLYLLASTFQELHLFKPVTSKEGNSEVYVICTGFIGGEKTKDLVEQLLLKIADAGKSKEKALFPLSSLDPKFLDRLRLASEFFSNIQMSVIHRNVDHFPPESSLYRSIRDRKQAVVDTFLELFPVRRLMGSNALFRGIPTVRGLLMASSDHVDPFQEIGETLAGTIARKSLKFVERLESIKQSVNDGHYKPTTETLRVVLKEYPYLPSISYGKPYKNVLSSRFTYSRILVFRQEFRDLVTHYQRNLTIPLKPLLRNHFCSRPPTNLELFQSLSKKTGCDLEAFQEKTKVVCFHEYAKNFLLRTDIEVTEKRLTALLELLQALHTGDSVYLCEYPLLTRLHLGLVIIFTKLFSKVEILMDTELNIHGIFLAEFKPLDPLTRGVLSILMKVTLALKSAGSRKCEEGKWPLEVVDMRKLCLSGHLDTFFTYNTSLLLSTLKELIGVASQSYQANYTWGGTIMRKRRRPLPSIEDHIHSTNDSIVRKQKREFSKRRKPNTWHPEVD